MLEPGPLHAWVRAAHATTEWTTSVCTGSLILGAAGVLDGLEATTHWAAIDELAGLCGVTAIDDRRVVAQGKVVTAAGVSSGIDMALWLAAQIAGDDVAKAIQLGIEYDPQPPFDSGSVAKADPELVAFLRVLMPDAGRGRRRRLGRRGHRGHLSRQRSGGRGGRPSGLAGRAGAGEAGVGRVDRPRRRRRPTCRRTRRRAAAGGGPGRGGPRARRA